MLVGIDEEESENLAVSRSSIVREGEWQDLEYGSIWCAAHSLELEKITDLMLIDVTKRDAATLARLYATKVLHEGRISARKGISKYRAQDVR